MEKRQMRLDFYDGLKDRAEVRYEDNHGILLDVEYRTWKIRDTRPSGRNVWEKSPWEHLTAALTDFDDVGNTRPFPSSQKAREALYELLANIEHQTPEQ